MAACSWNKQLPAYKPLLEQISKSPEFDAFPQDVFRIGVYDALNTAKPRPTTVAYGQLQDAFRTAFADMSNGVPVSDALTTALVRTAWTQHGRWQIGRTTELTRADENGRTFQGAAL